jgi:hypothetical protein
VERHVRGLGDQRLLIWIAVGDQPPVRRDDHREAARANADLVDHPPHFLQVELADQPARRLVEAGQPHTEDAGRKHVFVDAERRHQHAGDVERIGRGGSRHGRLRGAEPARGGDGPALVEQRQLAELTELQDVVAQDLLLLRAVQAGVLHLGGERLEDVGMPDDVAADFLGGAGRDIQVAADDRLTRAGAERQDRHEAEGKKGQNGGAGENEGESGGNAPDAEIHRISYRTKSVATGASCSGYPGRARPELRTGC